jgi:hypothetical protein
MLFILYDTLHHPTALYVMLFIFFFAKEESPISLLNYLATLDMVCPYLHMITYFV